METKFLLFFLLILCTACGSHIVINPEECETKGMWGKGAPIEHSHLEVHDFMIEESIWTPLGFSKPTQVYLKKILEDHRFLCHRVDSLEIETQTKWYEGLLRFVPFMSRKTVIVKGRYKPESFTEEK